MVAIITSHIYAIRLTSLCQLPESLRICATKCRVLNIPDYLLHWACFTHVSKYYNSFVAGTSMHLHSIRTFYFLAKSSEPMPWICLCFALGAQIQFLSEKRSRLYKWYCQGVSQVKIGCVQEASGRELRSWAGWLVRGSGYSPCSSIASSREFSRSLFFFNFGCFGSSVVSTRSAWSPCLAAPLSATMSSS